MRKRMIAFAFTLCSCILLCACGGAANQENTETKSADAEVNANSDSVTKSLLKDVYIIPQTLENPDLVIVWDTSEEAWNETLERDPNAFNLVWSTKSAFEAMYGGHVTIYGVGWGDMMNKALEMAANGEPCDLVQANDQNFPRYARKNAVQDISKYIDLNDDFWYKNVTDAYTFAGIPYVVGAEATPVVISFNKTLFEEKGVKTPREYFNEGNWTWDTFREVGIKMTEDTDHDGTTDIYGFGWWDSFWVQFLNSNNATTLSYLDDGSVQGNFFSDAAKEGFDFLKKAYLEDKFIVPPENGDFFQAYKEGKLAMTCEYGFTAKTGFDCDYEIDWAPLPTGPSGSKYDSGGSLQGFAIPANSANPEGAAAFIRMAYELLTDYNLRQRIEKFGLEDVELMNQLAKHIHFSPIGVDNYWDAQWQIYHGISTGLPMEEFTNNANDFFKNDRDNMLAEGNPTEEDVEEEAENITEETVENISDENITEDNSSEEAEKTSDSTATN